MSEIKTWEERMPPPRCEKRCDMNCSPRNPDGCDDCWTVKIEGDPIKARDEEIAELRKQLNKVKEEAARAERNRDMWKGQCARQADQLAAADGYALMPLKLTAENGAKAALIGEFFVPLPVSCPDCGIDSGISEDTICETCGDSMTVMHHVNVPWTVIKKIYAKAVEHFVAQRLNNGCSDQRKSH